MMLDGRDPSAVQRAAQALRAGELLGLPTETVYGLAADASNDAAVAKIFQAKGRPPDHPLIVHVADASGVLHFVPAASGATAGAAASSASTASGQDAATQTLPVFAQKLMEAFWPGPLTLILPRRPGVAAAAAGGQGSIGLRCPSHPVAQAVLRAAQALNVPGLAAPSANQFGRVSPTTAAHVLGEFGDALLILDGGPCEVGIESTIVDCTRGAPVLLRPGRITREQIETVTGLALRDKDEVAASTAQATPRASGTLESHYAPRAKVRLMDAAALQSALDALDAQTRIAVYARSKLKLPPGVRHQTMPQDASAAAHELFATLRALDEQGVSAIWVQAPPVLPEWEGVADRLKRAAA
jgi:L-threonylcarbamoyladenylate synthase